ncbi:MAG: T9SS type A sorting domain-containing protein, partial [Bacteroidetes bacterium]|nr:T9SS type A sorting domain-containing protein [Bacteroidota bacterium]
NEDRIESLLAHGWSGDDNEEGNGGWITARHNLPGLGNLIDVRFRFVFGSDGSIVNDGFAFDTVCIGSKDDIFTSTNPVTEKTSELKIYPNPFTGTTTIEFPNPGNDTYKLIVTDLTGKTVRIIDNITGNQFIFNRKELPVGFYLIELRGTKRYFGKMLIE